MDPKTQPSWYFPTLERLVMNDILSNWPNAHTDILIWVVRSVKMRKAKWKPLELPLSTKRANYKQHSTKEGVVMIKVTINNLKCPGMVIPWTYLFNFSIWPRHKTHGSCRIRWTASFIWWWFQCSWCSRCGLVERENEHTPYHLIGAYWAHEWWFC